jgi:restriction endonuclease S subunit
MTFLLKDIARIRAGYSFRGGIEAVPDGAYRVVQIKDVRESEPIAAEDLVRTDLPDAIHDHLLRRGDVLFVSRGTRKQAVVVDQDLPDTIFGSQFFACEPNEKVDAAYLAWYLNQQPAQRYFEEMAVGSHVRIVNKESMERLQVTLPSLETQRKIVHLYRLGLQENQLLEEIQRKRGQLVKAALLKIIMRNKTEVESK